MKPLSWMGNRYFHCAPGIRKELGKRLGGKRILAVTGASWLERSGIWDEISSTMTAQGIVLERVTVDGEPGPEHIDRAVDEYRKFSPQGILAIGGGSVLDAGKAIGAMFCHPGSVTDYLEGVGCRTPEGSTLPVTAMPTTSGTGSEATKNAVISRPGPEGFKKSLRHDGFIPETALIDPELLCHCPETITLYSGMDALTQLMEGWISTSAHPFSDMTSRQGLMLFAEHFPRVLQNRADLEARMAVGLASYLSGMTLAQAGLGTVHGIAGVLGGLSPLPHGMICSRLIPSVFRYITKKNTDPDVEKRLNWMGELFHRHWPEVKSGGREGFLLALDQLQVWMPQMDLEISSEILEKAAKESGDKNSPVKTDSSTRLDFLKDSFY